METVLAQTPLGVEELAEKLNALGECVLLLGDGAEAYEARMQELLQVPHVRALPHMDRQRAGAVAALGAAYYRAGKTVPSDAHTPIYLRQTQAERERAERLKAEAEAKQTDVRKEAQT